jgi:hypothetical protein
MNQPLYIDVNAAGYARRNKPVTVKLPRTDGAAHAQIVELDAAGHVIDDAVAAQLDPDGTLTLLLKGQTPARATRRYRVELGSEPGATSTPAADVHVRDGVVDEGQASYKITTPTATYWYHKLGGGFSSLLDVDGRDWINHHPTGDSAGRYRGIPNLVHPEGYFHPTDKGCASRIVSAGPRKVTIASTSEDGAWACKWDLYPSYATLTVTKAPRAYWFLYEGTPGGTLDETHGYILRSNGVRTSLGVAWEETIPAPEWVAFYGGTGERGLFIVHHEADQHMDSYWPMENNMTVFGFGRLDLDKYMTAVPAHFTLGFAETADIEELEGVINNAYQPLHVTLSQS